jgi:protein involved in polysaccharide export with SLBB domain
MFCLKSVFLVIVVCLASAAALSAQDIASADFMNQASRYQLGNKDEILMNVNVWGYVARPGQYVVPRNTDLISLISFAGGPARGANLNGVQIIRAGAHYYGSQSDGQGANGHQGNGHGKSRKAMQGRVPILKVPVGDSMEHGDMSRIPILQAGDAIIVPQSFSNKIQGTLGFNSLFTVIAAMASLALVIDRL